MAYENVGAGIYGPYFLAGAPVAGTNEVQTLTFGGTTSGGSMRIALDGVSTGAIAGNATAATFVAAIQAGLDATFGSSQIVAAAGTYTAGAGTITLTFSGSNYARKAVNNVTVSNSLTGTSPTVAVAETTPGVTQTLRDAAVGAEFVDTTNRKRYINTGTVAGAPTWTVLGTQV